MDLNKIAPGRNPPEDLNVMIEIPQGSAPIKYEIDKVSGALFVNRFLHTAMFYPANYGFIPQTLSADGDRVDCLVVSQVSVTPGAIIRCRPVGALLMEDEKGIDEKIIAVPVDELNPYYQSIVELSDLPEIFRDQIEHFFRHYKDLERGKWYAYTVGKIARSRAILLCKGARALTITGSHKSSSRPQTVGSQHLLGNVLGALTVMVISASEN